MSVTGRLYTLRMPDCTSPLKKGFSGIFSASEPWWQLAFLVFWDQIYTPDNSDPLYGGDPTGPQDIPADLFSPSFYERRKKAINDRAEELLGADLLAIAHNSLLKHGGEPCRILRGLTGTSESAIYFLAEHLPAATVVGVCRHLLEDFTENRKGLPDLVGVFEGTATFVEVKSERDHLSRHQLEWLRFLAFGAYGRPVVLTINHSTAQIERLRALATYPDIDVKIRFRHSSSRYLADALRLADSARSHDAARDEQGRRVHEVELSGLALDKLRALLLLVALWKGTEVQISGHKVVPFACVGVLDCFANKLRSGAGVSWCMRVHYVGEKTAFCCNEVRLENSAGGRMPWQHFGTLDRSTGVFLFDRGRINNEVQPQIEAACLCPIFDRSLASAALESIPPSVSPLTDQDWGFVDEAGNTWMRYGKGWISNAGSDAFPGVLNMVSVVQYTSREVAEALQFRNVLVRDGITIYRDAKARNDSVPALPPSEAKRGASGCLGLTVPVLALVLLLALWGPRAF